MEPKINNDPIMIEESHRDRVLKDNKSEHERLSPELANRINFIINTLEKSKAPDLLPATVNKIYQCLRIAFASHNVDHIIDEMLKRNDFSRFDRSIMDNKTQDAVLSYIYRVLDFFEIFQAGQKVGFTENGDLIILIPSKKFPEFTVKIPLNLFLNVYNLPTPLKEIIKDDEKLVRMNRENKLVDGDLSHKTVYRILRHMIGDRLYDYNGVIEKNENLGDIPYSLSYESEFSKELDRYYDTTDDTTETDDKVGSGSHEDVMGRLRYYDLLQGHIKDQEDADNVLIGHYFNALASKRKTNEAFNRAENLKSREMNRMFRKKKNDK